MPVPPLPKEDGRARALARRCFFHRKNGDSVSNGFLKPWQIEQIRQTYAPGTRIELQHMEDSQPVPDGTRGSVAYVDDAGTIHMKWDNGRTLGLVPGEDQFRKLTAQELQEEAAVQQEPVMKMN